MGNEMGNNNTSGLQEEDNTVQDKSVQEFGHADDLKGQNHVVPETLDEVSQGKEDPNDHDQKAENKEEGDMKTEGKKSLDAARTDNGNKEQNHEVPATEDIYVNEKGTCLASINPEGVAELHDDNQKPDEKEEADSMIPVDTEKSLREADYAEEAKGQDHLIPAAEDKNTRGNETELASHEHDGLGLASPRIEDRNQDEKEKDTNTIPEVEETPLQEAVSTDKTNTEARVVAVSGDEDTCGTETGLVLSDGGGMAYPSVDKQKNDEKEEDGNINDEAEEQSSQEAASIDVLDRRGDQLAVVEDKTTDGNETGLVSIDPKGTANSHSDNPKDHDERGLVSIDPEGTADPHYDNPKDHDETGFVSIDPEETANPHGDNPKDHDERGLVSIDPEGTADPHYDNPKDHDETGFVSIDPEAIDPEETANPHSDNPKDHDERGLVSNDPEGTADPHYDNPKDHDETGFVSIDPEAIDAEGTADPHYENPKDHHETGFVSIDPKAIDPEETANPHGDNPKDHDETSLVSIDPEGIADPHSNNPKDHEKEENNTNPHRKNPKDHDERGLVSIDPEGTADPHYDNPKDHDETGFVSIDPEETANPHGDNPKDHDETGFVSIDPEAIDPEETANPYRNNPKDHDETGLISIDPEGIADPHGNNPKDHEKEENNTNPHSENPKDHDERGLVSIDPEGTADPHYDNPKDHDETGFVSIDPEETANPHGDNPKDHDETGFVSIDPEETANPYGNNPKDHDETGLISIDPEGIADPHGNNPKDHEKEENNTNAEHQEKALAKDDNHEVDIEEKNLRTPGAKGEDYTNTEVELASGDPALVADTLDNQTLEGQGKTELQPPAESTEVYAKPSEVVSEGSETQPASSSKNLEDHEMQKEPNFEENLPGRTHHFENRNSMMEAEDKRTSNSISGAASSTSHDFVPQGAAVLEPEDHELAKIDAEQLVLECHGPLKSEDMIIPSSTCVDRENGFILDSSISTNLVESVLPDQSPEVGMEGDEFKVKEMATKEVSSEEKFELKNGGEAGNNLGTITTIMTDLPMGFEAKCNGGLPNEMNSTKNDSHESQVEAIHSDETVQSILVEVTESKDNGRVRQKATSVKEESENGNSKHSHCQNQSGENLTKTSNGQWSKEGSKADELNAFQSQFVMNGHQNEAQICLVDTSCDSKNRDKNCQFLQAKFLDNGHPVDASINYHSEAPEEQEKDSQREVQLIIDPIVISADNFFTDQIYKEEESEEKKIAEEMVERKKDSYPIENDDSPGRENGRQSISSSYPLEQAETFLSPSPFLHEKQQQDSYLVCKKLQNINESMAEGKQESSECPKSTDPVTMGETKPSVKQSSEQCAIGETQTPEVVANADYYQRETVGRLSIESTPYNSTIHAQRQKSPSFDLDLRIDARAEDSDQTPLLFQDKTTIESFSRQADATDPGKPVTNTEYGKSPSQYEAMEAQVKVVTLERSDSEKSKTPFLGFLKENEEADQMLINPKQKDNQSTTKKTTKVSTKDVTSATTKRKEKRKPRASLFGTCMCCATVTN